MADAPKIANTPGVTWKPRKDGHEARWHARADLIKRGYEPKSVRLWAGKDPSPAEQAWISDRCIALQDEMLVWGRGGLPSASQYDGTLKSLIACYQTDPDSSYRKLRYHTRVGYDTQLRRLEIEFGSEGLADIKARQLLRWHEGWTAGGRIAMAHSLVSMLRTVVGFGATFLESGDCARLSGVLHGMRFAQARARIERITAEQATALRAQAHAAGLHSIALAQALQFECILRQKDVVGEWVPLHEPGTTEITSGNEKWLRGLRWSEIDSNLILRHTTSKRQKDIEFDLKLAPMVMEELPLIGGMLPTSGAVIQNEKTGLPYPTHQFRRLWRKLADDAGIPKSVFNMDSRAGAISEATDAGAELEHVRHAATHSDISMTQRYSRGATEKTANVMQLRAKHRNKSGT